MYTTVEATFKNRRIHILEPVKLEEGARLIVTILGNNQREEDIDIVLKMIDETCGIFKGKGVTTETIIAEKQLEKELER